MSDDQARRPDQKFCFSCATPIHMSADACTACGARQPAAQAVLPAGGDRLMPAPLAPSPVMTRANQVFCRGCGQVISNLAPYCPHCGAPQAVAAGGAAAGTKNKYIAALFAFFLGGFGVHKFYLGEVGLGIIYLLFCWTFIPALIAFIECIVYLATSDETFARRYG